MWRCYVYVFEKKPFLQISLRAAGRFENLKKKTNLFIV